MFEINVSKAIIDDTFANLDKEKLLAMMKTASEAMGRKLFSAEMPTFWEPLTPSYVEKKQAEMERIFIRSRHDFGIKIIEPRRVMLTPRIDEIMAEIDDLCRELGIDFDEFMQYENDRDRSDDTELECSANIDTMMES